MKAQEDQRANSSAPAMRWQRAALALVFAILVAVGVVFLLGRAAGFTKVLDELRQADKGWLFVCFLAIVVEYTAYTVVFRRCAQFEGGVDPGPVLGARAVLASLGATQITAAAGAGGLAVTYWCFRRLGDARDEAFYRLLGLNTLVYFAYGLGGFASALLVFLHVNGSAPRSLTLTWICIVPSCVAAAWYVTRPQRAARLTRPTAGVLRRLLGYAVGGTAFVRRLLGSRDGGSTFAAAGAYWAGDTACFWASQRAFDVRLPIAVVILAYVTGYAAMFLPLPLLGISGVDAAMTFALVAVGVPLANALLAVIGYRLFAFWMMIIPSGISLALLPRTGRALERAARRAQAAEQPAVVTP